MGAGVVGGSDRVYITDVAALGISLGRLEFPFVWRLRGVIRLGVGVVAARCAAQAILVVSFRDRVRVARADPFQDGLVDQVPAEALCTRRSLGRGVSLSLSNLAPFRQGFPGRRGI